MIILARKGTDYVLQLRKISDLTLIHEFPLSFNFTVLNIKLIGSIQWGLTFTVSAQYLEDYYADSDAIILQFVIKDDKIISKDINFQVTFDSLHACSRYLVLYSLRTDDMRILHAENMTTALIKRIGNYQRVIF